MVTFKRLDIIDTAATEKLFEKKAAEGYYVKRIGGLCQEYKKGEPGRVKYYAELSHKKPDAEKKELYRQAGWEFAAFGEYMCIWYSKDTDAVEPHTDKAVYSELIKPVYSKLILMVILFAVYFILYSMMFSLVNSEYIFGIFMSLMYRNGAFFEDFGYRALFMDFDIHSGEIFSKTFIVMMICLIILLLVQVYNIVNCMRFKKKLMELSSGEPGLSGRHKAGWIIAGVLMLIGAVIIGLGFDHSRDSSSKSAEGASDVYALTEELGGMVTADELYTDDYALPDDEISVSIADTFFGRCVDYRAYVPTPDIYINDFQTGKKTEGWLYINAVHYYADDAENSTGIYEETVREFERTTKAEEYNTETVKSDRFDRIAYYTQKMTTPHYDDNNENVDIFIHRIWLLDGNNAAEYCFHSLERSEKCQQIVDNIEEKWSEIFA